MPPRASAARALAIRLAAVAILGALSAGVSCAEAKCKFNSECQPGRCVAGSCVRDCIKDIDCPDEKPFCNLGVCAAQRADAGWDTAAGSDAASGAGGTMDGGGGGGETGGSGGGGGGGGAGGADSGPPDTRAPDTRPTGTKKYLDACVDGAECASVECTATAPRFCTRACASSSECAFGQVCTKGVCRLDDAGAACDTKMPSMCLEACYGTPTTAHCTHSCSIGGDCPAGFACMNVGGGKKVCVDIERPCSDAADCASATGFCGATGAGCTSKCDSASDCPRRLVGLPEYTCEVRSGTKVCIPPSDVLGSLALGAVCSSPRNKCRSGACDDGVKPPSCAQRCTPRGGCPTGWGCFPLVERDDAGDITVSLTCTRAGSVWLGGACGRARDCATGLCDTGGYCTRMCVDGACPTGMTCKAEAYTATDGTPVKICRR